MNDQRMIYLQGPANLSTYENKYPDAQSLADKKFVFVFPGNPTHHTPGTTMFTVKRGDGLAHAAEAIGNAGYPVLSLPTTGMEGWTDQASNSEHQLANRAIADLYKAIADGYRLMIPIRPHANTTYFDSPLQGTTDKEPSFWGGVQTAPNKPLANLYTLHLDNLRRFTEELHSLGEATALTNLAQHAPEFAQTYRDAKSAHASSSPPAATQPTTAAPKQARALNSPQARTRWHKIYGATVEHIKENYTRDRLFQKPTSGAEPIISINFSAKELLDTDTIQRLSETKGLEVTSPSGQKYSLSTAGGTPQAVLTDTATQKEANDTPEEHQQRLAVTLMNMMENVLTKSSAIHISTPDPFLAKVAEQYIAHLRATQPDLTMHEQITLTTPASNPPDPKTPQAQQDAEKVFNKIISAVNLSTAEWLTDARAFRMPTTATKSPVDTPTSGGPTPTS